MGSIPLPALDLKPVQQPDALGSVEKMMALKSMMGQQQLQQGQIQLQQQQVKDQQALTTAFKNWDPKAQSYDDLAKSVTNAGGSGNAALQIQQHALQIKDTASQIAQRDAETGSKNLDTIIKRHDQILGALDAAKQAPDDQLGQHITDSVNQLAQEGILTDPNIVQKATALAQLPPAQARQQLEMFQKTLIGQKQQFENAKTQQEVETGKANEAKAKAETDQKVQETAWYKAHGMAPGVPAETQGMADWLAKNPGKGPSDYQIAMKKVVPAFQFNLQSGLMSDQAKDMAAENYYQTGQLPAGARSPAIISGIINRAAELHPGGNLAGNKAAFEANKASYENVTKTLDTLSAFESAGLKNLKQFTDLADKLPDTGVPWANTPVRLLNKNLVGNEYMPAIEAARTVALREIARVTNDPKLSGVLTDSARQEVSSLSPENATLPQIKHVVHVLQQDMANVHSSLGAQKADIGKRLGFTQQQEQTNNPPSASGASKTYQGHTYTQQQDGTWKRTD